jgi:hypothetical protein
MLFALGTKIEDMGETYVAETKNLEAMKVAFAMVGRALEDHLTSVRAEKHIKETEYGSKHVIVCIDIVKKLFNDAEAKRLQALGGADAMSRAVAGVKLFYDDASKQRQHEIVTPSAATKKTRKAKIDTNT